MKLFLNEVILGILLFTLIVNLIYALIKLRRDKSNKLTPERLLLVIFLNVCFVVYGILLVLLIRQKIPSINVLDIFNINFVFVSG